MNRKRCLLDSEDACCTKKLCLERLEQLTLTSASSSAARLTQLLERYINDWLCGEVSEAVMRSDIEVHLTLLHGYRICPIRDKATVEIMARYGILYLSSYGQRRVAWAAQVLWPEMLAALLVQNTTTRTSCGTSTADESGCSYIS